MVIGEDRASKFVFFDEKSAETSGYIVMFFFTDMEINDICMYGVTAGFEALGSPGAPPGSQTGLVAGDDAGSRRMSPMSSPATRRVCLDPVSSPVTKPVWDPGGTPLVPAAPPNLL